MHSRKIRVASVAGELPQALQNQANSTKSIRRSPDSTFAIQLWGTSSNLAS
jgi:hypothetical protein